LAILEYDQLEAMAEKKRMKEVGTEWMEKSQNFIPMKKLKHFAPDTGRIETRGEGGRWAPSGWRKVRTSSP